jgi:hypothetical protein
LEGRLDDGREAGGRATTVKEEGADRQDRSGGEDSETRGLRDGCGCDGNGNDNDQGGGGGRRAGQNRRRRWGCHGFVMGDITITVIMMIYS